MRDSDDQRINGTALEMIMQDVLQGVESFTGAACSGSDTASMEIMGVENTGCVAPATGQLIPFPAAGRK